MDDFYEPKVCTECGYKTEYLYYPWMNDGVDRFACSSCMQKLRIERKILCDACGVVVQDCVCSAKVYSDAFKASGEL